MRKSARCLVAASMAIGLGGVTGCDDSNGLGAVRPELELEPEPQLIDFGNVVLGKTSADPHFITVRNSGDGVLTFDHVEIAHNDAGAFPSSKPPMSVVWARTFLSNSRPAV